MTTPPSTPQRLLLATDLSPRCDRAFDRAVMLAGAWGARLTVAHAIEVLEVFDEPVASRLRIATARAIAQIESDLADAEGIDAFGVVEQGKPDEVVLSVAAREQSELIVTGIARNDPLGQPLLGNTVAVLARRANVPVLVVRRRAREPYGRVVVAGDHSEAAAAALKMALRLFPLGQITVFHALDMPFPGWVDGRPEYERQMSEAAVTDLRSFFDGVVGAETAAALDIVAIDGGGPARALATYTADRNIELAIAGTHGRTGLLSAILGSIAQNILDEVSCDLLIVPTGKAE